MIKIYGSEAFYGLGQHQAGVWIIAASQSISPRRIPKSTCPCSFRRVLWNNDSTSRWNNRFVHYLYLSSDVADVIDYYFVYGPDFDKIIAGYRRLTGAAPLFGKWAYGFWQSKYSTQPEILDVAAKYPDPEAMIDQLHRDHLQSRRSQILLESDEQGSV